jgi:hypothetical protein|tara:strand:- start:133 stop:666 length:534 start_codon:yes stop_codon:yes gene_type:complete
MQDVKRIDATTVRIFTNINNGSQNEYVTYDLIENGAGGGATDTTQVTAIMDTWANLLQGNKSSVRAPLPISLLRVDNTISNWSGTSSGVVSGIATLDFGLGSMTTSLDISATSVTASSTATVHTRIEATPEHSESDLLIDPIRLNTDSFVVGVGFRIVGAMDNAPANGTYMINWRLN